MTSSDSDYLRWLENPDFTLSTPLRKEIAARFRELTRGPNGELPVYRQGGLRDAERRQEGCSQAETETQQHEKWSG